ncbi:dihydrodipicolinate synthase/N-acetylneuraminate lyase [Actinoalloteichus hoggarensis]|uniref:Dihydrodipicolinate synthase n=1 Tax=Actinoalloteichus hoggarensis TaxID=1470176 RepID=A0A221W5J2_9PSEU|nr:dihydrodipicolinate synthase family protein [Actinoalloteichus hoggarensis]ASO20966.1 dihydrodipicolinate synthase [Actinoalloteichus hoggarensis]MBB5920897.1 dihydrodipicolinate synthase/N-acetylneuraminate lyase [Actinoalloteichus hoggarensis]
MTTQQTPPGRGTTPPSGHPPPPFDGTPGPAAEALIDALRYRLLPAVLTPMHADGRVDLGELERYATGLLAADRVDPLGGPPGMGASGLPTGPAADVACVADAAGSMIDDPRRGPGFGETPDTPTPSMSGSPAAGRLGDAGNGALGGVAVWAHTGRGLRLARADRLRVLQTFRQVTTLPIVAGAGTPDDGTGTAEDETVRMAVDAAEHGADAVMVYPPAALRGSARRDAEVLRLHERIAAAVDLPLLGFYLHGEAGGYEYPTSLLGELSTLPSVAGVKLATLDRAMACQDAIIEIRRHGRLAVTGEDRMFGPSLMWGADAALAGIAAARADLTASVLRSWHTGAHAAFHRDSAALDRFAAVTFFAPIEGYVQRMFWAAVHEGLLAEHAAHDPYGPALPPGDRQAVSDCLDTLTARPRAAD